jgi:DNA-directed RNA polymerase subunit B"
MNREKRRDISRQYFSRDRLAEHHFRSFNAFLNRGMQEVVDEKETIDTDIGDKEGQEPVWVELGNVRITTPRVREADGSEELLYPQEARLRNITYSAPVFMEMTIMRGGEEEEPHIVDQSETKVGRMPIMIGSDSCNIVDFDDEELIQIGEDPADPGGYFIVNGSERVLMTSEDLAPNKILAETRFRSPKRSPSAVATGRSCSVSVTVRACSKSRFPPSRGASTSSRSCAPSVSSRTRTSSIA